MSRPVERECHEARRCEAPGCNAATRHGKPMCSDHVHLMDYPAALIAGHEPAHYMRTEEKPCRVCGSMFEGLPQSLYCAPKCRYVAQAAKKLGINAPRIAMTAADHTRDRGRRRGA